MKANSFQHGFTKRTAPLLLALLFASTAYSSIQTEVLKPTRQQVSTSDMVVERLEELHYRKFPLDDALSAEVFDRYLKDLDSSKSYFLKSDVEEFSRYRVQLDDALQKGNLQPGFDIFNRYQQRIAERLDFAINLVTGGMDKFDFTKLESLETDPEKSEWPASRAESDDLWRKRVKHTIINMRLNSSNQF